MLERSSCGELVEISNFILIGFILRILTTENCLQLLQFYLYCITDFNKELSRIYVITEYMMYFI